MKFQIRGGEGFEVGRRKDRVSTVTFTNAPYSADTEDWNKDDLVGNVTFTMTTAPSHMEGDFPCNDLLLNNHLCPQP